MANKIIKSANLLPEFLRTDKNTKFLTSTLDQLIQPPQLDRIDGYIGSKLTPNYNSLTDNYIPESLPFRRDYQLEPALIIKDAAGAVSDVIAFDDLANEIATKGGKNNNLDRLFRSEYYSYNPHIDWDKLVNYQQYYWLVTGPETININVPATTILNIDTDIIGNLLYTTDSGVVLSNGMKIQFSGNVVPANYEGLEFFVEGVGTSIRLISYIELSPSEDMATAYNENFDATAFDNFPFDNFKKLPIKPEYITINRASNDLNPWSQYNRWVHSDIIAASAKANNVQPLYQIDKRAQRPIIEFNADLQLFNFGSTGVSNVDLIDTTTLDAFSIVEGSSGYYIDGVLLQQGHRVIFNADPDVMVRGKVYQVNYLNINNILRLQLQEADDYSPVNAASVSINLGKKHTGTAWWFNGTDWQFAQQHITLNQAPLFDLFDNNKNSYSNGSEYISNFLGNKIFGYDVGTVYDSVLNLSLKYKNDISTGSFLFKNYFMTDSFTITKNNTLFTMPTSTTYCKFSKESENIYANVWEIANQHPMSNSLGYYELPLGLTNNPLNGPISLLTLGELTDHLSTMIYSNSSGNEISSVSLLGNFPGNSNLRDIGNISKNGTRLISNTNPMVFSQMFIGKKEHSVIDAIGKVSDQYNQFKMALLTNISTISNQTDVANMLDSALLELNKDKDLLSPYYLSDMVAYGTDKTVKDWIVTNSRNTVYPISSDFDTTKLSNRSVLVYLNSRQLLLGKDYEFIINDSSVKIVVPLSAGDKLSVVDYFSTLGAFVPPTPTKLGLYPKFIPSIFVDDTYVSGPVTVIQGHDGSIMTAYQDFRDGIILEFESRVYNNIKAEYRTELFDINAVKPNIFKSNQYSLSEITEILQRDFIKWAGFYGIDYTSNNSFNEEDPFTWNYRGGYNTILETAVSGSWRAVYDYFYGTTRPHSHPWEMLGITEQPLWWESEYGPAPYTSGNDILWTDIEQGIIRYHPPTSVDVLYARPGLSTMLPVDAYGNLVTPNVSLVSNITSYNRRQSWKFGDQSPAETAWRRSSYWPFAVQRLLALTSPASYAAAMYDPSRLSKNIANQWTYGAKNKFLDPKEVAIHGDNNLTSGYSVYVVEAGLQRTSNYIQELKQDLKYVDFSLFYKVGGFVSKNKLQITIDSYAPTSISAGALLPQENYNLILNTSNPIKSVGISGLVVQKSNGNFLVKGYDKFNPYFNVYDASRNANTPTLTVGGVSESYVTWGIDTAAGSNLPPVDTTTAMSSTTGRFYQAGQLVSYNGRYYRVKVSHTGESSFNLSYYQAIPSLPQSGGAIVQTVSSFGSSVKQIPYGTELSTIQDVYDLIVGYGKWLEDQGFIFDEYNTDFNSVINWDFTAKEFLYWTTQNWAENSVITLSPFADQIKYTFANSVVDNVFDSFYEYSILQASGASMPQKNLNVTRADSICTISTESATDGIFFAELRSIQKEHAMVFDNTTVFNDIIYDIETGYRQRRMKLSGFRTADWNGDYFSPGFVYDTAVVTDWETYLDYQVGSVVKYAGLYYSAIKNIIGTAKFDFTKWSLLGEKPLADLLPNFDYKINQFEDFYSLDIDNFDSAQQKMAQHLIGYTPRIYLNNIFTNPIAQYKFYQGFIKEKGTKNSINKLATASIQNLQGEIFLTEEWAFRVGQYGSYSTYQEVEIPLVEGTFIENPQIINFVDTVSASAKNDLIHYVVPADLLISPTDYTPASTFAVSLSTYLDNEFKLPTAGFVRFDDVTSTAYSENSLLDIANNGAIVEGDTIWMGFRQDGEWDVLRYQQDTARIVGVFVNIPTVSLIFVTNKPHSVLIGEVVSITNFNSQVNGVYRVIAIPNATQFTVTSSIISIENAALVAPGELFKFTSHRFNSFDTLPPDQALLALPIGVKFWSEDNGTGKWAVYQKIKNYGNMLETRSASPIDQQLGSSISKKENSNIIVVGAPYFCQESGEYGEVYVYDKSFNSINLNFKYTINDDIEYYTPGYPTSFGYTVVYDDHNFNNTGNGLIIAGAPSTSFVKTNTSGSNVIFSVGIGYTSTNIEEGLVKISSINATSNSEVTERVLVNPAAESYARFGSSLYMSYTNDVKLLLVGAPYTATTGTGVVYAYQVATSNTVEIIRHPDAQTLLPFRINLTTGSQWGYCISGSDNSKVIAISAPGYLNNTGVVQLFNGVNFEQTISSPFESGNRFGEVVTVSADSNYVFITAISAKQTITSYGKVAVYKRSSTGAFVLDQILLNPVSDSGLKFGYAIASNSTANLLVISSVGINKLPTTFDKSAIEETFDVDSTRFYDVIPHSGTVYVYNRHADRFVLAEELHPSTSAIGTDYGFSVALDSDTVYIGAPANLDDSIGSAVYTFRKQDINSDSLKTLRQQEDLISVDVVQRAVLIDSQKEEIVEYLDIIDPLKGRIAGVADQEIKYKSSFDPAAYSIGIAGTIVDPETSWLDNHIGELWWDFSTVKYVWYEQGELSYRKNNWGTLFPGATIDIYEWVSSEYMPSEWSSIADTALGLTKGISGQPKFADNSVISVKQVYSATSNSFSNVYYFWVKNKVTLPIAKNRRTSAYQVASMISAPSIYGMKFVSVIAKNAVAISNISPMLVESNIHLNISSDIIDNSIPKHTEWLLLQEGAAQSVPNTLLEKKLLDSLLGHDALGNIVPSPELTARTRYGIGIRPQQTLFKDRKAALRNVIEFSNSILLSEQITNNYSFFNLQKQELVSNLPADNYDQIVEDNDRLELIDTYPLMQADAVPILSCTVSNGQIRSVAIINPGVGYKTAPSVTIISNTGTGAEIATKINSLGQIISATIIATGSGFVDAPELIIRPYTVVVQVDSTSENKWSIFVFNATSAKWVKVRSQQYNTPLYWKYVDWQHASYNQFADFQATIDVVYQLDELIDLSIGQYVKVKNGGDGRYIILEKTNVSSPNSIKFNKEFNLVYKEHGTIQILDSVWNSASVQAAPDLELQYILFALRDDLFVGKLKINWNLFFFKAVKYSLSEQKLLDWAFKTSFVTVTNRAGALDQRPVYKLQNSAYYEDYLREVKPYHTNIRRFVTGYDVLEPTHSYTTDFDLPAIFNKDTANFETVNLGNALIDTYPWKAWKENYLFEIGSISVGNPGAGYTSAPTVSIQAALGDDGVGATADAYIRSGEVSSIVVTNPGTGYKTPPIVIINGGGIPTILAYAYAQLSNGKVRSNKIGIKFDRINRASEFDNSRVVDTFTCNGSNTQFVLSWLAEPSKNNVSITLDGELVLSSDYTIQYYTEKNEYSVKLSKLVFLAAPPAANQILTIQYSKNINLMNATDRILNYYSPSSGMQGNELSQLMSGIEYAGVQINGIGLDYSSNWDLPLNPFGTSSWADDIDYYTTASIVDFADVGADTLTVDSIAGLSIGQYANVISSLSNKFSTSTEVVVTSINTVTNQISFSSTLSESVISSSVIEFWAAASNAAILDSVIDGGSWAGISPNEITVDGYNFLSAESSFAPEELVPGHVVEAVGINVYTKNPAGAPVVLSNNFSIFASTGTVTTATLSITPPSFANIAVVFDNKILTYTTSTTFTTSTQFAIDWTNNKISIPPQSVSGKLGYTIISIGGGRADTRAGVIDNAFIVTTSTSIQLQSAAIFGTVNSAYVTVNGIKIASAPTPSYPTWYSLTYSGANNNRAAVDVHNLPPGNNAIHAWFFGFDSVPKYFNEITEQVFTVSSDPTTMFVLKNAPGNIEPYAAQAIVEISDATGRRRLLPPPVSYYEVANTNNRTFVIDNNRNAFPGTFTIANVKVYVNGIELRPGFDFTISSTKNTITIGKTLLTTGDVVAIVGLVAGEYDFNIVGSTLTLMTAVSNVDIKVLTYTDHDNMLMRTESFPGIANRRYKISRQILDDNYVWVQLNGIPLIDRVDYEILDDRRTVQLSDAYINELTDTIVITSVGSQKLASTVLGYRIFKDIFNRTHYKRLSGQNSTYLTHPVLFTDDKIYVSDVSVLTPPYLAKKIPGVVIIDDERIEFFKTGTDKIKGDYITQLRRSTLGTSAKDFISTSIMPSPADSYATGTTVIDQSPEQTIPFKETILKQKHLTTAGVSSYMINSTYTVLNNDGISLSSDDTIAVNDQVSVYYAGRLLSKTGSYRQDLLISFDSPVANIKGSVATVLDLPATNIIGDAYVVTKTNQVWVYSTAPEIGSLNKYIYTGLNYVDPEFSIDKETQLLTLNIQTGVDRNIELIIVKKEAVIDAIWNDQISISSTKSLMQSTTTPARFLQARPAELPDKYYYGNVS